MTTWDDLPDYRVVMTNDAYGNHEWTLEVDNGCNGKETWEPLCKGWTKWDGCSNFSFYETDCLLHTCGRQDLVNLGVALGRVFDLTGAEA